MLEEYVNFNFQQISSRIIGVFYVLCNFPDGWKKNRNFFRQPETRSALADQKNIQLMIFVQTLIDVIEDKIR